MRWNNITNIISIKYKAHTGSHGLTVSLFCFLLFPSLLCRSMEQAEVPYDVAKKPAIGGRRTASTF